MPASEESRLTALLWSAASRTESRLSEQEIDQILGVKTPSDAQLVPEQRSDTEPESWSEIRTDSGDQKWLIHIDERHRRELS